MIYGYARVSTAKQMKNGNSINDQIKALIEAGAEKIVSDDYTGTKMDRPQFTQLIESLQEGDKLIVTKLDRFARTAIEGSQVVRELVGRGVTVHVLNMGIADNSPMGHNVAGLRGIRKGHDRRAHTGWEGHCKGEWEEG